MNTLSYSWKITALSVLFAVLGGCVPIPHYAIVSPAVIGKVHRNGKPVENAMVYVEHPIGETCSVNSEVLTWTNYEGHFSFEARKEFRFFMVMDPWQNWQVCITDDDSRYQGWYQNALGGPPLEIQLDCNLENEPQVTQIGNTMGKIMGVCSSN